MSAVIYDKTDKGREEIATRRNRLPLRLRTLLLLMDGKNPAESVLAKLASTGVTSEHIQELCEAGYVQLVASAEPVTITGAEPMAVSTQTLIPQPPQTLQSAPAPVPASVSAPVPASVPKVAPEPLPEPALESERTLKAPTQIPADPEPQTQAPRVDIPTQTPFVNTKTTISAPVTQQPVERIKAPPAVSVPAPEVTNVKPVTPPTPVEAQAQAPVAAVAVTPPPAAKQKATPAAKPKIETPKPQPEMPKPKSEPVAPQVAPSVTTPFVPEPEAFKAPKPASQLNAQNESSELSEIPEIPEIPPNMPLLQALYVFYTDTIRSAMGLRGFGLQLKVEEANTVEDFRRLRHPYYELIKSARGKKYATILQYQLDQLLARGKDLSDAA